MINIAILPTAKFPNPKPCWAGHWGQAMPCSPSLLAQLDQGWAMSFPTPQLDQAQATPQPHQGAGLGLGHPPFHAMRLGQVPFPCRAGWGKATSCPPPCSWMEPATPILGTRSNHWLDSVVLSFLDPKHPLKNASLVFLVS